VTSTSTRPAIVAVAAGVVFLLFGLGKFVAYDAELDAFRSYGLPAPEVAVVAIGVFEVVGGALLIARRALVPVALLLAATMTVAIAVSGIAHGELVPSLTVAPALLVAMLYLLRAELRASS
jgi:uncharacterized membrane protein YphA (DoxX/SURF4 family)